MSTQYQLSDRRQITAVLNQAVAHVRANEFGAAKAYLTKIDCRELAPAAQALYQKLIGICSAHSDSTNASIQESPIPVNHKARSKEPTALGYCILLMRHEKDVTKATVSNLLQQISPEDRVFVLFNGFEDTPLKRHFEQHSGVHCFSSPMNHGVAGGRNILYRHIIANEPGISHIVTLDNDVLLPNDLNEKTKQVISKKYESLGIGVLGGLILDYKVKETRDHVEKHFLKFKGYLDADCYNIFLDDIREYLSNKTESLAKILWHIGMHPDYERVYVNRERSDKDSFEPFLAKAPNCAELVRSPHFSVSNVPGCFQVVSRERLLELGYLEEKFSPYFFEDSEFCIRAIRKGYRNIISTDLLLMHGTDNRHTIRKSGAAKLAHLSNEYRARYVLLKSLDVASPAQHLVDELANDYDKRRRNHDEYISGLRGIRKGVAQYFPNADAEHDDKIVRQALSSFGKQLSEVNLAHTPGASAPAFDPDLPPPDTPLPRAYFSRLKRFRNAYRDQECLIVCNGPSLRRTDLGRFAEMPTFAVNSTYILQEQLGFKPTFFTVEDNHVVVDNLEHIRKLDADYKFFPEKYRPLIGDADNIFYLPAAWDCYFKSKVSFEYPEFSEDIARVIFTGQTVTYLNLQMAFYFGFKTVYIVGLDFSYSIPRGATIDKNSIDHDDDDPNHFHPTYFGKGKQWHFPKLDSCMTSYGIARERYAHAGKKIIDLTVDGKLNVFEKADHRAVSVDAHHYSRLGNSLEFGQYFLDALMARIHRLKTCEPLPQITMDQKIEVAASSSDPVRIYAFTDREKLASAVCNILRTGVAGNQNVLVIPPARLVVTVSDISILSGLPKCNWIDSTLNNKSEARQVAHTGHLADIVFEANPEALRPESLTSSALALKSSRLILLRPNGVYLKITPLQR